MLEHVYLLKILTGGYFLYPTLLDVTTVKYVQTKKIKYTGEINKANVKPPMDNKHTVALCYSNLEKKKKKKMLLFSRLTSTGQDKKSK